MKVVYSSFKDFSKKNKSILNLITDKDNLSLLESIWNARDGEVHQLESKIEKSSKDNADLRAKLEELNEKLYLLDNKNKDLGQIIDGRDRKVSELKETLNQHQGLLANLNNDLDVLTDENNQLEAVLKAKDREIQRLQDHMKVAQKEFDSTLKNNEKLVNRAKKLDESFSLDKKYIKELERRVAQQSEKENELHKLNSEYSLQYKGQTEHLKNANQQLKQSEKKIRELSQKVSNKDVKVSELSEKINSYQSELSIAETRNKKLNSEVDRLELERDEYRKRSSELIEQNNELKKDNVEVIRYSETMKKELSSLELTVDDLHSNQTELNNYVEKLRLKANRDSIKIKEIEAQLDEADLRRKLALNEKSLVEKELKNYRDLMSDFEDRLKKPQRRSNIRGVSLDH